MAVNLMLYRQNLAEGKVCTTGRTNTPKFRQITAKPENVELLLKFDNELGAKGMMPNTRSGYLYVVRKFLEHIGDKDVKKVDRDDIINFITKSREEGLKSSTVTTLFISASRFLTWLNNGKMPDYLKDLRPKRRSRIKLPEEIISPEEVLKLKNCATSSRDKAMISVLYESATRAAEFLGLRIKDIEFNDYGAKIRVDGKTGERVIPLIDSVPDLKIWLNDHPDKNKKDASVWIDVNDNRSWNFGRPLKHNGLYGTLKRLSRKAQLDKKMHPHLFRHSRLTFLAKNVPESVLRKFAGWTASSNMTEVYVHLNGSDTEEILLKKVYGKIAEEKLNDQTLRPVLCRRCNTENPKGKDFCYKCQHPLNLKALEELQSLKSIISDLFIEFINKGRSKEALESAIKRINGQ